MSPVYRSPGSGSPAAATTPARLAQEFGGQVRWRERSSGEIEVATLQDGRVDRYLVHEDGRTTLLTSSRSSASLWGKLICFAGFLLCLATMIVLGASDPGGKGSHAWGLLFFLAGMALAAIGGTASANADDLGSRLKKLQGVNDEWHEPTNLHDWLPRSVEQLSAVEHIAAEHDGLAFVRDIGARTVDVCAMRKGHLERYWVDELGRAELAETKPPGARHYLNRGLCAFAVALLIGIVVVAVDVKHDKGLMFLVLFGALAAILLTALVNDSANSLERRVRQLGEDGHAWVEIRTRMEDPD